MTSAILLSAGTDSVALASIYRPDIAITVDYGQIPFPTEKAVSRKYCGLFGIRSHVCIAGPVCLSRPSRLFTGNENDSDFVPLRNQHLLTTAASYLSGTGVREIIIGIAKDDSDYPDCKPEFISLFNDILAFQSADMQVLSPGSASTSVELLKEAEISYEQAVGTFSCHSSEIPCNKCRGCQKRLDTIKSVYGKY